MAVDIQRVVLAAVEAALGDDKPEKSDGLSASKAVAVGAVLVTAGRVAAKPAGRFAKEKLRERLSNGSESDKDDEYPDAYDDAEAAFDEGEGSEAEEDQEPEAEEDQEPEAEEDQEPKADVEEDEEARAEERAAADAGEEDESDAGEYPGGGPGPNDEAPDVDDEGPAEAEAESDVYDVKGESEARPSKTHPRPPIFDRAGASGSKIRPAARPPVAKVKRPSGLKNGSKPARPRRPRPPVGRT
jgi:hypothetical protein